MSISSYDESTLSNNIIIFSDIKDDAKLNFNENYFSSEFVFSGAMNVPSNLNYFVYFSFAYFLIFIGIVIILFRKFLRF